MLMYASVVAQELKRHLTTLERVNEGYKVDLILC